VLKQPAEHPCLDLYVTGDAWWLGSSCSATRPVAGARGLLLHTVGLRN
jgi:hypothetical protein